MLTKFLLFFGVDTQGLPNRITFNLLVPFMAIVAIIMWSTR